MTLRRPLLSASFASSARRLGLPALLLAAGCAPATVEGTSVGNPGLTAVRVAPADQLAPSLARLDVATVTAVSCSGDRQTVVSGVELDLLAPSQVALPGGALCGLELAPAAPLQVEGTDGLGVAFRAALTLPTLRLVVDTLPVDGAASVLELATPGWLSPETFADGPLIEAGDPRHDGLVELVLSGAGLYPDDDADLEVDDSEREDRRGERDDDDDDDDDEDGRDPDEDDEAEVEAERGDAGDDAG